MQQRTLDPTKFEGLACDICIVGSGAAAISLAHRLCNSNARVLVLESSTVNERQPSARQQLMHVRQEMTTTAADPDHRFVDPHAQPLYDGKVHGDVEKYDPTFLTRSRIRVYGGTTNCWGGWTRTLQPVDFKRGKLGGPWPITREELEPYYQEAQWLCSLGDPEKPEFPLSLYDDPSWLVGRSSPAIKPIGVTPNVRTGMLTVLKRTDNRLDFGLDFQLTWGRALEDSRNVQVIRNANVRRIQRSGSRITRVSGQTLTSSGQPGAEFVVDAQAFVLAAGGIEVPRLMLLSGFDSQTLGEGFMIHPLTNWGLPPVTFTTKGGLDPAIDALYSTNFHLAHPSPHYATELRGVLIPTDAWLETHDLGNFRAMVNFAAGSINFNWQQAPDKANRIALSTERDLFGDPKVDLQWKMKDVDWATLDEAANIVGKALEPYVDNYVNNKNRIVLMGDHPMGATRMAASAGAGVVNPNCLVYGTDNLLIASSSVFPSGGWSNPTLTIVAMARRLAAYLLPK